ncbi:MAG TPA: tetratricopeptide repeat protein [Kiritimatiellia bacterium]|nr:tetratricopeptide repeat protein [Kiritimatiellia bacterium]
MISLRKVITFGVAATFWALSGGVSTHAQEFDGPEELYSKGLQAYLGNRFEEAIPYFRTLDEIFGREPQLQRLMETALYGLASSLYNVGEYVESIAAFTAYQTRFPQARFQDEVVFRIATAYQILEDYPKALETYRMLLTRMRGSPFAEDAGFQVALTHMAANEPAQAVAAFEAFVTDFPRSDMVPQALVFLARSYFDAGDLHKALDTLERVGDQTRQLDHIVYANFLAMEIGDAAFEDVDFKTALRAFRRVRTIDEMRRFQARQIGRVRDALEEMRRVEVDPANLAEHFRMERRARATLANLSEAMLQLAKTPDYDAGLFHRVGRCFYSIDRFWEARTAYARALAEAEDAVFRETAHFDLILAINRMRRFEDLVEEADRYLELYGKDKRLIDAERVPSVAFMRAEAFLNRELFEEAEAEMRGLAETYPRHVQMPRIRFYIGLSVAMQERFDEAIEVFAGVLKDYPDHLIGGEVAYWMPVSMFYGGRYEEAIPLFDAYVETYPGTVYAPEAAYRSALCKYAMEDFEGAARELKEWLEVHPTHYFQWEARVTLGDALAALGELDEAEAAYRGVTSEGGAMHYLAITQLNHVYRALDEPDGYRRMAEVHTAYMREHPNSFNMIESAHQAGWALRQIGRLDEARRLYWGSIERFGNNREWEGFGALLKDVRGMYGDQPEGTLDKDMENMMSRARRENRRTLLARLIKAQHDWSRTPALEQAEDLTTRFRFEELDAELLAFVGDAFARGGQPERGMEVLDLLLTRHPESRYADVAYARKAEALIGLGQAAEALQFAETAMEKTFDTTLLMEAMFVKARALKALERFEEAIPVYNDVIASRVTPRALKPRSMLDVAACLEAMGDFNRAIPYYQRIYVMYMAYTEEVAQAYLRSARAFLRIRDRDAAINTYREMLGVESLSGRPELEEARRRLTELEARS